MDGARRFTKVNPPHLPLEDSEYIGRTRGESLGIHLELVGGTIRTTSFHGPHKRESVVAQAAGTLILLNLQSVEPSTELSKLTHTL